MGTIGSVGAFSGPRWLAKLACQDGAPRLAYGGHILSCLRWLKRVCDGLEGAVRNVDRHCIGSIAALKAPQVSCVPGGRLHVALSADDGSSRAEGKRAGQHEENVWAQHDAREDKPRYTEQMPERKGALQRQRRARLERVNAAIIEFEGALIQERRLGQHLNDT